MITLQSYRQDKVLKPSTIYAPTEVFTSATYSTTDLNEDTTEEERIAESKILRRNEQIRLKKTKQNKRDVTEEVKEENLNPKQEENTHKSIPSFKNPFPFPSLKPLMKNLHIIDKRSSETLDHI